MIRALILILLISVFPGCVYRIADIPAVPSFNVAPQKIYIHTGGEPYGWQSASRLASDLQKAGFKPSIIGDLSEVSDEAYIIDEIEPWGECFSEPLLFVLTLGIVPHIGCEEYGHAFMLHQKGSANKVRVNAKYTVKVMAGWLVWPAALSNSYAFTSTTVDVELQHDQTAIRLLQKELQNAL
ncbi:MAG TPA: hypothetical protein VF268_05015 [Gammaproteobacteria bacterium]